MLFCRFLGGKTTTSCGFLLFYRLVGGAGDGATVITSVNVTVNAQKAQHAYEKIRNGASYRTGKKKELDSYLFTATPLHHTMLSWIVFPPRRDMEVSFLTLQVLLFFVFPKKPSSWAVMTIKDAIFYDLADFSRSFLLLASFSRSFPWL